MRGRARLQLADTTRRALPPPASSRDRNALTATVSARGGSPRSRLLPRVEEVLRIKPTFHSRMHLIRARAELPREPVPLDETDTVFARDRSAKAQSELEQLLRDARCERELVLVVGGEQERGVEVAVSCVSPRASGQSKPPADLERLFDRVAEAVERDRDILARLSAALRADDERKAVAPAPQRCDLGGAL